MTTTATLRRVHGWHAHPSVRSDDQLTLGERAADRMRNSMGSWGFVFAALAFLALWMLFNRNVGFDKYPFIMLNLVLSCVAALQGAILLIAAKRSDQIASELAQHDYATDVSARDLIASMSKSFAEMTAQHAQLQQSFAELRAQLATAAPHSSGVPAAPLPRNVPATPPS
jgi:uncharacterized membrane protein